MFNKHLLKVILGFSGMIIFGLASLVIIDNYKDKKPSAAVIAYTSVEDISNGSIHAPEGMPKLPQASTIKLLSYQDALRIYTGKTIGFDGECHAEPNTMTFKNNTKIMLDNLASQSRTIKIGKSTSIMGHGFKIVNLTSSKLPTKLILDCDSTHGVANITLLK